MSERGSTVDDASSGRMDGRQICSGKQCRYAGAGFACGLPGCIYCRVIAHTNTHDRELRGYRPGEFRPGSNRFADLRFCGPDDTAWKMRMGRSGL